MNKDYENIKKLGYEIQVTYGKFGKNFLYLLKNGIRTTIPGVEFYSNNLRKSIIYSKIESAKADTHLGRALSFLSKLLTLYKEAEECGVTIKR
ncbi:hypothetical protein [Achromobacter marplatensis]|jgi:hypothetical protein|uniref:hypothetical protein n=1 Tax=Achromobacter marplatensis TaxID=470868 RepID=UPI003D02092E